MAVGGSAVGQTLVVVDVGRVSGRGLLLGT